MLGKTNGFARFMTIFSVVMLVVFAVGCKDKGEWPEEKEGTEKKEEMEKETQGTSEQELQTETADSERYRMELEKRRKEKMAVKEPTELQKIASGANGWEPVLRVWTGKDAPDTTLTDLSGKKHSIASLEGKKVILVKWSTYAKSSKEMVKQLDDLQKEMGDRLAVLAITSERADALMPVVEDMGLSVPVIKGPHRLPPPYRSLRDMPSTFFIDTHGKIQMITRHNIPQDTVKSILAAMNSR